MPRMKKPKDQTQKLLDDLNHYMTSLKAESQSLYHRIQKDPDDRPVLETRMKKLHRHMLEVNMYINGLEDLIYQVEEGMEKCR